MRRRHRQKKSPLLKMVILIVIISFIGYWKFQSDIHSPVDEADDTDYSVQIKTGENVDQIANDLEEKELIKSSLSFKLYVKFNKLDTKILAGRFLLKKSMDVPTIIEYLSNPIQAETIITIQEGLRINDIDSKLVDLGLSKDGEFEKAVKNFDGWKYYDFLSEDSLKDLSLPLEGFIYPDTYFLDPNTFKPEDLIYLALDNFENKWEELDKTGGKYGEYSINEIITMASIIENEVFGKEDRRIVSGILWKRLENNWPLGADATLLYITKDRTITSNDLQIDSAYNTRKNLDLPPGPISNPSIEAIEAAIFPTSSEWWYYLTTLDTGEVIYSRNNEEHNANRAKYL